MTRRAVPVCCGLSLLPTIALLLNGPFTLSLPCRGHRSSATPHLFRHIVPLWLWHTAHVTTSLLLTCAFSLSYLMLLRPAVHLSVITISFYATQPSHSIPTCFFPPQLVVSTRLTARRLALYSWAPSLLSLLSISWASIL